MEKINEIVAMLGVDLTTAGVWAGAGLVLGVILIGRRPLGLIGDILFGVIGGIGGGWAFNKFEIDLGQYATQISESITPETAALIGAFAEAFVGALVLLVILRILVRR